MALAPISTINLPSGGWADELVCNTRVDGIIRTVRVPFAVVQNQLGQGIQGGVAMFLTAAEAAAELDHADKMTAMVIADPVAANNGYYRKTGAAGAGNWVRTADLPYSFIPMTVTGGSADAIAVSAQVTMPVGPLRGLFLLAPSAPNTGPVTISVNGGEALPVTDHDGDPLEAGYFAVNRPQMMLFTGASFQLATDVAAEYWAGQAQASRLAAEAARDAALAAANFSAFDTIAALRLATGLPDGRSISLIGFAGPGDMPPVNFVYSAGSAVTPNTWTVIAAPDGGRFICTDSKVDARLFGMFPSAVTDYTANLTVALACGKPVEIFCDNADDTYVITSVPAPSGAELRGTGPFKPTLWRKELNLDGGIYLRDGVGGKSGFRMSRIKFKCTSPNEATWTAGPGDVGSRVIPWINTCRAGGLTDMVITKNGALLNIFGTTTTFTGTEVTLAGSLPAHAGADVYKMVEVRASARNAAFYSEGLQGNWNSDIVVEDCEASGFWYIGFERCYTRDARFVRNKCYGIVNRPFYTYLGNSGGEWNGNYVDGRAAYFTLLAGVPVTDYAKQSNTSILLGDLISNMKILNETYEYCWGRGWSHAGKLGPGVVVENITTMECGYYGIFLGEVGTEQGSRPKITNAQITGGLVPVYLLAPCEMSGTVHSSPGPGAAVVLALGSLTGLGGKETGQKLDITIGSRETAGAIAGPAIQITGYTAISGRIAINDGSGIVCDIRDCAEADLAIASYGGAYNYLNGVSGHVRLTASGQNARGLYALACPRLKIDATIVTTSPSGVLIGAGSDDLLFTGIVDAPTVGVQIAAGSSRVRLIGSAKGSTVGNAVINGGTGCDASQMFAHT